MRNKVTGFSVLIDDFCLESEPQIRKHPPEIKGL